MIQKTAGAHRAYGLLRLIRPYYYYDSNDWDGDDGLDYSSDISDLEF